MVRRFDDEANAGSRGLQIWQILIGKAHLRQTMTYGELAALMGFKGAGTLAHLLGRVMFYCRLQDLPPLTALVVNQETGLPGDGLPEADLNSVREDVYSYDWYGLHPPTAEALDESYQRGQKETGSSVA